MGFSNSEQPQGNLIYGTFSGGKVVQSLGLTKPSNMDGVSERTLEKGKNQGETTYERKFSDLSGFITDVKIIDNNYGNSLELKVEDNEGTYIFRVGATTTYGKSFIMRCPNIDFKKEVKLSPYDFTDEAGKRRTGLTIYQEGSKVASYYTKDNPNGLPQPVVKKMGGLLWDDQDFFLMEYVRNEMPKIIEKAGVTVDKKEVSKEDVVRSSDTDDDGLPF